MRLRELVELERVEETHGNLEQKVLRLTYDSRMVRRGDIFFAVPGAKFDGHDFALQACNQGATAVVLERHVTLPSEATWIRVHCVRRAMGIWASAFHGHPSRRMTLVGVTGTNGKTTLTYLLESIFTAAGGTPGIIGTVNYRYGKKTIPAPQTTPEAIELQSLLAEMSQGGVERLAMEVSSHALALDRVRGIHFDGAVFTNLTHDHLDFHKNMQDYFLVKSRLFTDYLRESAKPKKFAVIHGGDPSGRELLQTVHHSIDEVISYGRSREWDVHPIAVESDWNGLRGKIRVRDRILEFRSRLIGDANLENILGAVAVGMALQLPEKIIFDGIAALRSIPGRLERIPNPLEAEILVDYAHTPDALERILTILRPLTPGRIILLFGCGGDRDRAKRPLMGRIAGSKADLVVLTSDNPRTENPQKIIEEVERGIRESGMGKLSESSGGRGYFMEADRRAAIRRALRCLRKGDLLLVAGKGHENYQILKDRRISFDDREIIGEELRLRDN